MKRSNDPDIATLYVDADLIVLNKPAGMLAVPGRGEDKQDCASRRAQAQWADALIVHRLDMATSGLLLMARGLANQQRLSQAFVNRLVRKRYLAVVSGLISPKLLTHRTEKVALKPAAEHDPGNPPVLEEIWQLIDLPLAADWPRRPKQKVDFDHGKPSQTRWQILSENLGQNSTRLLLEPITGRTHQLRVHLAAIGHAILGDTLYPSPDIQNQPSRLLLHAQQIEFPHPQTGEMLRFECSADF